MRSVWAAAFLLRRLRAEAGVVLLIVLLVGVTSFLFAGAPRLFNLVADQGLRTELEAAPPAARSLELTRQLVMPAFEDPLAVAQRQGETELGRFPDSVRSLVTGQRLVATSGRFAIPEPPRYATFVALRHQDGIEEAIEVRDGRLPRSTGEQLQAPQPGIRPPEGEGPGDERPRIEIAVSDVTAEAIGVRVGDSLDGTLDDTDPLIGQALGRPPLATFEVVGVFAIADPAADLWYGDYSLYEPSIRGSVDNPIAFATGLVAPEAFPDLTSSELPFRYAWRYPTDGSRIDAGQLDALVPDLRRLTTQFGGLTGSRDPQRPILRSGLLAAIEDYQAERAASEAVLSIAAIGPIALAGGAIAMVAVLLVGRRRPSLVLARDRGASGRVILGAQLWEAVLVAGAAALAGLALALNVVPGRASALSVPLAVGTAAGAVLVLLLATVPVVRRPPTLATRDEPPPVRASPRRLVLELTAVGIALAGIGLLQQRGLSIGGGENGAVRFDPFLAAVPLLTGLAVGIVATRLYPLPVRVFGWLAARRRDLVPVLGLRSVSRRPSFATLPLLILMLTAAFGSFASVVLTSVERGQDDASWAGVGADYRIQVEEGSLAGVDATGVPGIEAVAAGHLAPSTQYESAPNQRSRIRLQAVDPAPYLQVLHGSRVDPAWPSPFLDAPAGRTPGTADDPIPAIVSRARPGGARSLAPGTVFPMTIGNVTLSFEAVEVRSSFPGVPPGVPFVVAPFDALAAGVDAAGAPLPLEPNLLFLRGSAALDERLLEAVERTAPSAEIASRRAWYEGLREAPLIAAVAGGFQAALLTAGAYAALAVLGALTLTAARRTQDLAFLRTLGLTARQAMGVTVVEHGIPVLIALVPGILTGIAVAALLEGSLGLGAFVGPEVPFRIHVDWAAIALVAASLVIVVGVAIGVSTWLARRARGLDALRMGEA